MSSTNSAPPSPFPPQESLDARNEANRSELWPIILSAGALCWLSVAIIGILWFWPISGTLQGEDYIISSGARLLLHLIMFLLAALAYRLGLGLGWPAARLLQAGVIIVNIILALIVVSMAPYVQLVSTASIDAAHGVSKMIRDWQPTHVSPTQWMMLLRLWLPVYVLGLVAVAFVATSRRSHRDSVRLADLSTQLANSRLATLSAQLHPHFLFNSLNAISGLVTDSPPQAVEMVARLGDFLRIAIDSTQKPWTSVEAELSGVEAYLAVQRSRFRDRLLIDVKVEPQALSARIPALLLQPLIENAIEHGLAGPEEALEVTVTVERSHDRLIVTVTNSTPGIRAPLAPAAFGNGLKNVNARLQAAYDGRAWISIGPDPVRGTRAELNVPIALKATGQKHGVLQLETAHRS